MIKKFKLLIILLLLTNVNTANSRELGEATEYKMTIHKLELCAVGSTIGAMGENWSCVDSADVSGGSIGTAIDIGSAAIGVGEAATTLGNFGKVKLGVKYTHIITTLSREFQITGQTLTCGFDPATSLTLLKFAVPARPAIAGTNNFEDTGVARPTFEVPLPTLSSVFVVNAPSPSVTQDIAPSLSRVNPVI